jgi:N-acetyl-gamma-glutamyl-phosphate reductase
MEEMAKMYKVGIIGGAGYTGAEAIRLLIHHPMVELAFVHSRSQAGLSISDVHTDLIGDTSLAFTDTPDFSVDVLFLCLGHGESKVFLKENSLPQSMKIIDLSQDFRDESECFVYGLPELQKEKIAGATKVANPGCFATAIQLALLPLANQGLLKEEIHVNATTGSTGAGQKPSDTTHFSWRANNLSTYKAMEHQHLKEIGQSLHALQNGWEGELYFIPQRGAFPRGILATAYLDFEGSLEKAKGLFQEFYNAHPFVHVSEKEIHLKQVVNTNKCVVHLQKHRNKLLITTVLDNLLKGASGQAVQNMNLMLGLEEMAGLQLKPLGY